MTSTQKSWLIITAPPAGYRKWHVLYFDELLLAASKYTAPKSSIKSLDHGQNCVFSSNRVNIEVWQRIILHQRTWFCHKSSVQCPITAKTSLSSSETKPEQLYVSIFAQCHSANYWFAMKQEVLCKSTLHYHNRLQITDPWSQSWPEQIHILILVQGHSAIYWSVWKLSCGNIVQLTLNCSRYIRASTWTDLWVCM